MTNTQPSVQKPALWTKNYILAFTANLLMFFAFYLLLPILPFYLTKDLGQTEALSGIILSLYTLAALCIRPFAGYIVDTFSRKPLYLICYSVFTVIFAGYTIAAALTLFIVLRVLHGFSFGITTVSGNTLAIDVMPAERRGEGIGYFGMTSSIAMALGPMTSLFLYKEHSFNEIFIISFIISLAGFVCIWFIKAEKKVVQESDNKISLDRFFLKKGIHHSLSIIFFAIGYGAITNYVGFYSETLHVEGGAGLFFSMLATGVICARLLSAKMINKGLYTRMASLGGLALFIGFLAFGHIISNYMFYASALLMGMGYGFISPTFQTMIINLAEHNRRGTANSTYLTSWDLGIGLGIAMGGSIVQKFSFPVLFGVCTVLILIGIIYFIRVGAPYFERNRLR